MNLTTLTDDDLDALRVSVLTEQGRRRMLAEAPAHAEALAIAYATAVGRKPGDPYQPVTGAHNAYPKGSIVSLSGDYYRATACRVDRQRPRLTPVCPSPHYVTCACGVRLSHPTVPPMLRELRPAYLSYELGLAGLFVRCGNFRAGKLPHRADAATLRQFVTCRSPCGPSCAPHWHARRSAPGTEGCARRWRSPSPSG